MKRLRNKFEDNKKYNKNKDARRTTSTNMKFQDLKHLLKNQGSYLFFNKFAGHLLLKNKLTEEDLNNLLCIHEFQQWMKNIIDIFVNLVFVADGDNIHATLDAKNKHIS